MRSIVLIFQRGVVFVALLRFPFSLAHAVAAIEVASRSAEDRNKKCHRVLATAWGHFERHPCSADMHTALHRLEAEAPRCRRVEWGDSFEASRAELHERIRTRCGKASVPERKEPFLAKVAEKKLERIAEEQQRNPDHAVDVSRNELQASAARVADGEVEGSEDLAAAQDVMATQSLESTLPKTKGGEGSDVVTVEDLRQVTAEALDKDPDSLPMLENAPNAAGGMHVFVEGDMRMLKATTARTSASFIATWHKLFRAQLRVMSSPQHKIAAGYSWPEGDVSYCFASDISGAARRAVNQAIHHYESKDIGKCIKFRQISLHSNGERCETGASVLVQSRENGCWGDVGYMGDAGDVLNLGPGCEVKGIAVHELGHILGMDHEQSRPDRDEYIKILYDHIKPGMEDQFELNPEAYVKEPYDYLSIMHYGQYTFSKNRGHLVTIEALPGKGVSSLELGQAMGLSVLDQKQLRDMYCPDMDLEFTKSAAKWPVSSLLILVIGTLLVNS